MIKVDDKLIKTFSFPGGERQVIIPFLDRRNQTVRVTSLIYNSDDIMDLLLTINAIKNQDLTKKISLTIPYFPYARQDRVCNFGEPFGARMMLTLINSLNCSEVIVYDPHSEVIEDKLMESTIITKNKLLCDSLVEKLIVDRNLSIISPDAGASYEVDLFRTELSTKSQTYIDLFKCQKTRDLQTGNIIGINVPNRIKNKNCIIIDDICDGGRTFIEIAKKIFEKSENVDLYLYVTHGIFSKGLTQLKEYFLKIICYHTFLKEGTYDSEVLTVLRKF